MLQFPEARLSCLTHNRSQKGTVGKPPESEHCGGEWPRASLLEGPVLGVEAALHGGEMIKPNNL